MIGKIRGHKGTRVTMSTPDFNDPSLRNLSAEEKKKLAESRAKELKGRIQHSSILIHFKRIRK